MPDSVYITRLSKFLPNKPVTNDQMEKYLGMVGGKPSKAKSIILRNNQIKNRYYVLHENGRFTYSNTRLTVEAINRLLDDKFSIKDIELLACGTTSPDQLLPSHASMVHGELKGNPVEIISPSGSCCSGMHALKYVYLAVLSGEKKNGVCTGSEKISSWMLSDGAGAALLMNEPNETSLSLRIEWIDSISYANELEICMYAGGEKLQDGGFKGWVEFEPEEILERTVFSLKQDVNLLGENIVSFGGRFLFDIIRKRNVSLEEIDYFFPHISSEYFRFRIDEEIRKRGGHIPQEKWFTNLSKLGNVGAASIYFMMEELFHSGKLKKGHKILCMVPESARFSYIYAMMTAV
ncbi:MAG: beta-ketoacyl-ACP synthase III [Bacteroidetes bacterium]|nr:beta-ketoacyl-ACP synthase III [Bacteroidota bacterium]